MSNSKVPIRFSSDSIRIVTADTRKRNIQGEIAKKGSKVAYPLSGILNEPGKIHKNKLFTNMKTIITRYPVNVLKKFITSFLNKLYILCHFAMGKDNYLEEESRTKNKDVGRGKSETRYCTRVGKKREGYNYKGAKAQRIVREVVY
jgi:hypothetical protein